VTEKVVLEKSNILGRRKTTKTNTVLLQEPTQNQTIFISL